MLFRSLQGIFQILQRLAGSQRLGGGKTADAVMHGPEPVGVLFPVHSSSTTQAKALLHLAIGLLHQEDDSLGVSAFGVGELGAGHFDPHRFAPPVRCIQHYLSEFHLTG